MLNHLAGADETAASPAEEPPNLSRDTMQRRTHPIPNATIDAMTRQWRSSLTRSPISL